MMKYLILVFASINLLFSPTAMANDPVDPRGRLNLSATGAVNLTPDLANLRAGVVTEAKTAIDALAENRVRMNEVFRVLKAAGINQRDIQTSNLNVSPIYSTNAGTKQKPERHITGYRTNNQVTVIVRNLGGLGKAIDALVTSGANTIGGVSFGLEDQQAANDLARKAAIAKLLAKAELYADAAGFEIGDILSISESGGHRTRPNMAFSYRTMESAPTPIAAGAITNAITVNASFEIIQ